MVSPASGGDARGSARAGLIFFWTRFKLAPCYAEGGWVKPSHAGAILAPNAAAVKLHG